MVSSQSQASRARRPSNAADDVASSNNTLTAFLGGRQKTWMGGMVPNVSMAFSSYQRPAASQVSNATRQVTEPPTTQSSTREVAPQAQYPPQILQYAASRPSPVPRSHSLSKSNSPSVPNFIPQASPPALPSAAQDQIPPSPAPSDETRFHIPSPISTNNPQGWPSAADVINRLDGRSSRVGSDSRDTNQQRKRQRMDSAGSPQAGAVQSPQNSSTGPGGVPTTTTQVTQAQGMNSIGFFEKYFMNPLKAHIAARGNWSALEQRLEAPRFRLLLDACNAEDHFYFTMHEAFCLSNFAPSTLATLPQFGQEHFRGFAIVTNLLLSNQKLPAQSLEWLAQFPAPMELMVERSSIFESSFREVKTCLLLLDKNWNGLSERCRSRWYPPLVDELVIELGIKSSVFQRIAFTGMYRGLWAGLHVTKLDAIFAKDQAEHRRRESLAVPDLSANKQIVYEYQKVLIDLYPNQSRSLAAQQPLPSNDQVQDTPATEANPSHGGRPSSVTPQQFLSASMLPPNHHPFEPMDQSIPNQYWSQTGRPQTGARGWPSNSPNQQSLVVQQFPRSQQSSMMPESSMAHQHPSAQHSPVNQARPSWLPQNSPQAQQQLPMAQQQFHTNQQQHHGAQHQSAMIQQQSPPIPQPSSNQQPPLVQQSPRRRGRPPRYDPSTAQQGTQNRPAPVQNRPGPIQTAFQQQHMPSPNPSTNHEILSGTPLLPPLGFVNPSHTNPNPLVMGLHQSHLRSPPYHKRNNNGQNDPDMRLYMYPTKYALPPQYLGDSCPNFGLKFHTAIADFQRKVIDVASNRNPSCTRVILDGAILYRLRCVKLPSPTAILDESTWAVSDTTWPSTLYVKINGVLLELRRKFHHGKDLPIDLTQHIRAGANEIEISILRNEAERTTTFYALAVEQIQVASEDQVRRKIGNLTMKNSVISIQESLNRSTEDDDDVQVVDEHISIDLLDPFTARIFEIPVRGKKCMHRECFNLETFLQTRKSKRRDGPTSPDEWRCPICGLDARPQSLIVDEFLQEVRATLENTGKLAARAILVKQDGSWEPKFSPQESISELKGLDGMEGGSIFELVHGMDGVHAPNLIDLDGND